jgi:uncharacterized protein (DUF1778 family)
MAARRQERMNFRVTAKDKELLRTAADLSGLDLSDFVLSKAKQAAEMVIEDQRDFVLPPAQFAAFMQALDRDPVEKPRLRRLFEEPSVLERRDGEDPQLALGR